MSTEIGPHKESNHRHALIFDFDGVLVDTEPLNFEAWNVAFEQLLGIRHSGSHSDLVGLTLDEIYQHWLAAGPAHLTIDTMGEEMKARLLALKSTVYLELAPTRLKTMPGSIELAQAALEYDWYVAIASRARRMRLRKTLEIIQMPALFDLIMGTEDVVNPKTDRKEHARAAQLLGVDPAHAWVIEDSASGVADAIACGIGLVIGLTTTLNAQTLHKAGAQRVVNHLSEVDFDWK